MFYGHLIEMLKSQQIAFNLHTIVAFI